MAEASAVIGLISSIAQFIDSSTRVIGRLNEFRSSLDGVPETFREIKDRLPLLIDTLKRTQNQVDAGHINEETAEALKPVVDGCLSYIKQLEGILVKALPTKKDSTWIRYFKALSSLAHDKTVQQTTSTLERYIQVLIYHQATSSLDLYKLTLQEGPQQLKLDPETPLRKTCFMVKFDQNPNFIGREDIIQEIDRRFSMQQRRVAIAGIGGVGKSQIAIEYCYRYRDSHPESQIFWVHAGNNARFGEAYRSIARELALPGLDDPHVHPLQLVLKWLSDDANGPWLLVLDNADDMEVFFGSNSHASAWQNGQQSTAGLINYLPRSSNGSIIITTRDRRVGERLANREKPIPVLPFSAADAEHLLQCRVPESEKWSKTQAIELLKDLDYLPLAITQAAAFISENGITIAKYVEILQADNSDIKDILEEDLYDPGRDQESRNSVFRTWELSFNRIMKQSPRAAEILSLMAVLDRHAILDTLLRNDDERKVEFITAIGILKAFSLITEEKRDAVYGIHRLVQLSTQMWLGLHHTLEEWQEKALDVVSNCCPPDGKYESWAAWGAISPHVQAVMGYTFQTEPCLLQRASILNSEGWYNRSQGRYEAAHENLMEALGIREKILGPNHMSTLDTVHSLGILYKRQHRHRDAETMYKRALAGYEKALGSDHTLTMDTFHSLGILYKCLDKFEEAESMYRRVLIEHEKALGPNHTSTLSVVHNLGSLYSDLDRLEEAEAMYKRALTGYEKMLGPSHESTLNTVNNLGILCSDQGKLEEAAAKYQRALTGFEEELGPDHVSTLNVVHNLGSLYYNQGKLKEADAMYQRALVGCEKTLGPDHAVTLDTIHSLGILYSDQSKTEEAEAMFRRALAGCEKILGPDHTSTMTTVHSLGVFYFGQGKLEEAEAMYQRAFEGHEKALGPNHTSTLNAVHNLGILYSEQDKLEEAAVMCQRALMGYEKTLGPDHTSTLDAAHNLGSLYSDQGRLEKAETMYQRALAGKVKMLGPDHTSTLNTVRGLGDLYKSQGKLEEAEAMHQYSAIHSSTTLICSLSSPLGMHNAKRNTIRQKVLKLKHSIVHDS